jgi:hypothetical protein
MNAKSPSKPVVTIHIDPFGTPTVHPAVVATAMWSLSISVTINVGRTRPYCGLSSCAAHCGALIRNARDTDVQAELSLRGSHAQGAAAAYS